MLLFLIFQVIGVGSSALCVGVILCFLVPLDPTRLSGPAAWLQADTNPPGKPVASRPFRLVFGLLAAGWFSYVQYGFVLRVLVDPWVSLPAGVFGLVFAIDEGLLIAWTLYLVLEFRRASRS
jgi:hypothetical protein